MVKISLVVLLPLSIFVAKILACDDCGRDSSSVDSNELNEELLKKVLKLLAKSSHDSDENDCRHRHRHHRHYKRHRPCDSSEEESSENSSPSTTTTQSTTTTTAATQKTRTTTTTVPATTSPTTTTPITTPTTTTPSTTTTQKPIPTTTTTAPTTTTSSTTASTTATTTTQRPTTTTPTTTTTTVATCSQTSIDLVFVVDASGSVTSDNFAKVLSALSSTVANITVGPNDNQSHVGLVTFDATAIKIFGLADYMTTPAVQSAITAAPYTSGGTDIESGMTMAIDQVFGQPGNRPNSPDIMIVITDGQDASNVTGAQQTAAGKNITVFSVGVGQNVNYNQLIAISGAQDRAFNATTFDFVENILDNICKNLGNFGSSITSSGVAPRVKRQADNIQQGNCDFEALAKVLPNFTKQQFCSARPNCNQYC